MTELKTRLDAVIARWNLLEHPFYQAWNKGELSADDLRSYAADYAPFIRSIALGWDALGNREHSQEEIEHAELWGRFARAIGTEVSVEPVAEGMQTLLDEARAAFRSGKRAAVVGALYAFEVQQPATAATKRVGLDTHYDYPADAKVYFDVHADEYEEAEMLLQDEAAATVTNHDAIVESCERVSRALWDALSSVYSGPCTESN